MPYVIYRSNPSPRHVRRILIVCLCALLLALTACARSQLVAVRDALNAVDTPGAVLNLPAVRAELEALPDSPERAEALALLDKLESAATPEEVRAVIDALKPTLDRVIATADEDGSQNVGETLILAGHAATAGAPATGPAAPYVLVGGVVASVLGGLIVGRKLEQRKQKRPVDPSESDTWDADLPQPRPEAPR